MNEPSPNKTGRFLIAALGLLTALFAGMIARPLLFPQPEIGPSEPDRISTAPGAGPDRDFLAYPPGHPAPHDASVKPERSQAGPVSDHDLLTVQLNDEGLAHYNREEYAEAADLFAKAYERAPENRAIQRNLALAKGGLGWKQLDGRQYPDALLNFQVAVRLASDVPDFFVGEGLAYDRLNDPDRAVETLKQAIQLDPKRPDAYKIIGKIYDQRDEIAMAIGYYEKGLELDPSDQALRQHLAQVRREEEVQGHFQQEASRAFTVKFEGREELETARRVLGDLEDAYRDVGQALSYYPEEPITVILYTERQFQDVTRTASWSRGIYDGKIRVPVGGTDPNPALLRKVLYHEYAHAVVHGLSRGADVPTWLNEGVAVYFENGSESPGEPTPVRPIRSGTPLVPLSALHGSFLQLSDAQAALAYGESYAAVKTLADRYGLFRIRQLLEDLGRKKNFTEAFADAFMVSYEAFQSDWPQAVRGANP
ncbi:MAG TPA: tetratricopeptide repeat protein [Nitrospiria bacterium]|nr:tetratricopeptide repeat protein [Nitrospiria bacterium]